MEPTNDEGKTDYDVMDYRQLQWAIAHDPCRTSDRTPTGAAPMGTSYAIALRIDEAARASVQNVELLIGLPSADDPTRLDWITREMHPAARGWETTVHTADYPHVLFYSFALSLANGESAYYIPRADGRSTAGELVVAGAGGAWTERGWEPVKPAVDETEPVDGAFLLAEPAPGFQITLYDPAFTSPDWLAGAVMYQIFPDRFARGANGIDQAGLAYHGRMNRPVRTHEDWNEPVDWEDPEDGFYDPVDFYGGTLNGIREKLPDLASLGVEVLYLNPVFEARSNHRYDTADYERIDPLLGTNEDFSALCAAAANLGISIVLDAVLSHTGADSRYFNEQETYPEAGALHDATSPYRAWYDFDNPSGEAPYRCWWGFPSLPEVNERNESWQRYMLDDGGILPTWISAGARGYRLDVADELPDEVLELIRQSAKRANPDAAIIGEVWEDPTTKISYGSQRTYALGRSLDSVMNYPLRNALLGFATGSVDALQLATFLKLQQDNYPAPMYRCLMNLLSSHDVERMRSVLALGSGCKHLSREKQLAAVSGITRKQDERAAALQRMIVAILYALPGTPCIYYGDERGLHGGGDPFCRATFPWNGTNRRPDCGNDLTDFYREVGQLRKGSNALRSGALFCCAPSKDVICIVRGSAGAGDFFLAIANRSDASVDAAFDLRSMGFDHIGTNQPLGNALGSGTARVEGGVVRFTAQPRSTAYFA